MFLKNYTTEHKLDICNRKDKCFILVGVCVEWKMPRIAQDMWMNHGGEKVSSGRPFWCNVAFIRVLWNQLHRQTHVEKIMSQLTIPLPLMVCVCILPCIRGRSFMCVFDSYFELCFYRKKHFNNWALTFLLFLACKIVLYKQLEMVNTFGTLWECCISSKSQPVCNLLTGIPHTVLMCPFIYKCLTKVPLIRFAFRRKPSHSAPERWFVLTWKVLYKRIPAMNSSGTRYYYYYHFFPFRRSFVIPRDL